MIDTEVVGTTAAIPCSSTMKDTATEQRNEEEEEEVFKLAPFNPSSAQIQAKAMEFLKLQSDDVLFDLGCGDGRLLITAAEQHSGLRCVGVEIDPVFVTRAQQAIRELPIDLQERVDIRTEDVLQLPMTTTATTTTTTAEQSLASSKSKTTTELTLMDDATALYLFVLPKGINKIMPLLEALVTTRQQQGKTFRILSYMFRIHEWEPTVIDKTSKGGCPIYYYEFPPLALD